MSFLKSILLGSTLLATSISANENINADVAGTFFSSQVNSLVYENVGYSGTYQTITDMIEGVCSINSAPFGFSGPLAPLNEQITWHFRGPIQLSNFAVYYPSSSSKVEKQKKREASLQRHHAHRHLKHKHKRDVAIEYVTSTVFLTQSVGDYQVAEPTPVSSTVEPVEYSVPVATHKSKSHHHKSKSASSTSSADASASTGDWDRAGFYDADSGVVDNLVFMNNMGSSVSGTWSPCFGSSLSYMSADGTSACSSPETLAKGVLFPSDKEFSIWSNEKCDQSCGYSQAGSISRMGFGGDNKVFIFRFQMPYDTTGTNNVNMPSIWALNSKIPRTQQYASTKENQLWPGAGEMDIMEVLSNAAADCLHSSLHSLQGTTYEVDGTSYGGGGSPHYFPRPVDKFMTAAAAFTDDGKISISILDDSFDFPTSLDTSTITSWSAGAQTFAVPS